MNENIKKKIDRTEGECKANLTRIANDKIFATNEKLFDLVYSQTSVHSQDIMYEAIKEGASREVIYLLMQNTDGYVKQERILRYSKYPAIIENEVIFLDMLNIENEYVEGELFQLLKMGKIKDTNEYKDRKRGAITLANFKGLSKKAGDKVTEIDYQDLKKRRILKDNVLKDVKKVLRNFGFLGIDIPRVISKDQDKNDVAKSFDEKEYQRLFNVDDFGDEKLFVNGIITNAKSDYNFTELVVIFKELLKKYNIRNYNINVYDEDVYKLICKYSKDNVKKVSDETDMIKFTTNEGIEFINVYKLEKNIVFNAKIDKIVDYIISEKKEHTVEEENVRDTLIYVDKEMKENYKIFDLIVEKCSYDYHAIIAYEEDIPRSGLKNYCKNNNIKYIGSFDADKKIDVLPVDKFLGNKPKTLGLRNDNDKNEGGK